MERIAFALASLGSLLGCAGAGPHVPAPAPASVATLAAAAPVDAAVEPLPAWLTPSAAWTAATPAQGGPPPLLRQKQYATLKGGVLEPSDDDIDPGWYVGGVYGQYVNRFLAFETETGYGQLDLDDVADGDLFSVPLLLNLRATFPVWILDVYGGGGIGSTYYDLESRSLDVEGWLFSGDLFVGAELAIRERMTVGLELKYFLTEEIERTDNHLDSLALFATVGWRF
jgi:hypothetical protein